MGIVSQGFAVWQPLLQSVEPLELAEYRPAATANLVFRLFQPATAWRSQRQ
jgi:hypothetical protein